MCESHKHIIELKTYKSNQWPVKSQYIPLKWSGNALAGGSLGGTSLTLVCTISLPGWCLYGCVHFVTIY